MLPKTLFIDTSWALCILQTEVALRACWGLPSLKCTQKWSIAHRYSSEYKNGEDHWSSDLLKALAVEVPGLHSEFECRLKESKLHNVVELELLGVIHTENTIKKKGKQNPFLWSIHSVCSYAVHCGTQRNACWIIAAFAVHCQEEHEEQTDPLYNSLSTVTYPKVTAEDLKIFSRCQVFKWQILKYVFCTFILELKQFFVYHILLTGNLFLYNVSPILYSNIDCSGNRKKKEILLKRQIILVRGKIPQTKPESLNCSDCADSNCVCQK